MRISDWSSDVCSSDLASPMVGSWCDCSFLLFSHECEAPRRILGATCRWPGGDLDDDEILRRIDIDGLAEDADRCITAGRRDHPKSEEHRVGNKCDSQCR